MKLFEEFNNKFVRDGPLEIISNNVEILFYAIIQTQKHAIITNTIITKYED